MKTENLLKAFGEIDDEHIKEAWFFRKGWPWRRILPIAASLILVAGALFTLDRASRETSLPADLDLPLLQLDFEVGGMGFEGYMAYHITDLVNNNPWREEMAPTALPVYEGPGYWADSGRKTEIDLEAMQAWALELAGRLGLGENELTVSDNRPTEEEMAAIAEKYAAIGEEPPPESFFEPTEVVLRGGGIKLTVDARFEARIFFDPAIPLPAEYNFTHHANYEDTKAAAKYLLERYRGLLGMKEPVINICGGDYDIYDRQNHRIEFYEGAGSLEEQIVSYNFCPAYFCCDDNGELFIAGISADLQAHKLGDYPLITVAEAEDLLGGGHFLTTVPDDFPGLKYVRRVELIYRRGWEATLLPYYRFYVELPEMANGGRKTFGAYYVPAVEERYIENMPLWDGSFN